MSHMPSLCSRMCSHADASDNAGKLSKMDFPAFHSLLVNPLLDVNLSVEGSRPEHHGLVHADILTI